MRIVLSILLGIAVGTFISQRIQKGVQPTYFEANIIENYFFENRIDKGKLSFSDVFNAEWKKVCIFGVGSNVVRGVNSELGENNWKVAKGRIINEGLLNYLFKIVVIDSENSIYIMNFDERNFLIHGPVQCGLFEEAIIERESKVVDLDSDGYGQYHTTYTISFKD